ncbi:MAG: hypothetical protein E3J35_00105 [Methanomassiliicoccales archaeon]|nr:MAG: hypothetical protein E3J35_00105 [Methanomassiliicoccales archaeon]
MMKRKEIVVGKKVTKPPWLTQKSVALKKYIREMYSPYALLVLQERGGDVYVDGDLVTDLTKRIKPTSDVVAYVYKS